MKVIEIGVDFTNQLKKKNANVHTTTAKPEREYSKVQAKSETEEETAAEQPAEPEGTSQTETPTKKNRKKKAL